MDEKTDAIALLLTARKQARLDSTKQRVMSVIPETDIELEPQTVQSMSVGTKIGRVWATLWGWTGDRVIRLATDKQGRLIIGGPFKGTNHSIARGTNLALAASFDMLDFGQVCHSFQIFATESILNVAFSLDGVNYDMQQTATPIPLNAGGFTVASMLHMNFRAQYVYVASQVFFAPATVRAYGYY